MASSPSFINGCLKISSSNTSKLLNRKPFRLTITVSLPPPSSPSPPGNPKKLGEIPSRIENLHLELPWNSHSSSKKGEIPSISLSSQGRGTRTLSVKSPSSNRSLWRRIFFASKKVRSVILLNVITLVYASDVPILKEVQEITDPAAFTAARFAISAIPFIPYILKARGDSPTCKAGIELGLWVSLGYLMQALGLLTCDAGRASFISMFTVVVVPLLDCMFGATVSPATWFGGLMSIVGVAMLETSGPPPSIGDLLNFLSAIFFGVHMLRTERISRNTNQDNFLPLLGYEVSVVAFFSLLWYFIEGCLSGTESTDPQIWTWMTLWDSFVSFPWIPAVYTGVFSTGLCSLVEMAAMRDVSATETAIIYGLEPVWGAGFAWFRLGERWGTVGWIGAGFVLAGSVMVQILGSFTPYKPQEDTLASMEDEHRTSKGTGLTASPVIVHAHKPPNILKK